MGYARRITFPWYFNISNDMYEVRKRIFLILHSLQSWAMFEVSLLVAVIQINV